MNIDPCFGMIPAKSYTVGDAMRSEYHPGRQWIVLGCSFTCGAAFFLFSAALILQAWQGHGSHPGNILRVGLAIVSLFVTFFFVALGALYRASLHSGDR